MASKSIDESKERARAAFSACGIIFPKKRVLISLSPSDIQKEGSSYDLPIALAILTESGILPAKYPKIFCVGELGLDGTILPVRGLIGRLLTLIKDVNHDIPCIIPAQNSHQARLVDGLRQFTAQRLQEVISGLNGSTQLKPVVKGMPKIKESLLDNSFAEVQGQDQAKRALEIAAAGRHNVLLYGPPGTGKTMLARALRSILPPLTQSEMIESTHVHSLLSNAYDEVITTAPLRAPHHSSSEVAIIGGGQKIKPGEISLAHNGVLFFDEMPEFSRSCLEALRQPLEDNTVNVSRASQSATYPASFIFIATMNPCPCGNLGSDKMRTCSAVSVSQYQKKLSGPILDRIDLFVFVDNVKHDSLLSETDLSPMIKTRRRVEAARQAQIGRNSMSKTNGKLTNKEIKRLQIDEDAVQLLNTTSERMGLSPRVYFKLIRIAQTIADLENSATITRPIIAEALQFREKIPSLY